VRTELRACVPRLLAPTASGEAVDNCRALWTLITTGKDDAVVALSMHLLRERHRSRKGTDR